MHNTLQTKEQYDRIIEKEHTDNCKINDNATHQLVTTVSSVFKTMSQFWYTFWIKPSMDLLKFWNQK